MEYPELSATNASLERVGPRLCTSWRGGVDGPVLTLARMLLFLGFSGGSGAYGHIYMFSLLALGFLCASVRAWEEPCSVDGLLWSLALLGVCTAQAVRVWLRLRALGLDPDLQLLYARVFQRLGVSRAHFEEIVDCCDAHVHALEADQCFAVEGKTSIDKLSVLLSGRVLVTVNGEFLHHILPFQFLDSPEWDSLLPSEEGLFQVTLRAEDSCRYVSWHRKKLYLLFSKHRYIARIFALVVRNDIAEKLFSLSERAVDQSGRRFDLRLPTLTHVPTAEEAAAAEAAAAEAAAAEGAAAEAAAAAAAAAAEAAAAEAAAAEAAAAEGAAAEAAAAAAAAAAEAAAAAAAAVEAAAAEAAEAAAEGREGSAAPEHTQEATELS